MEEGGGLRLKLVTVVVATLLGSASLAAAAMYGFTSGKALLFALLFVVIKKQNRFDPELKLLNFEGKWQKINQQFWPLNFTGLTKDCQLKILTQNMGGRAYLIFVADATDIVCGEISVRSF